MKAINHLLLASAIIFYCMMPQTSDAQSVQGQVLADSLINEIPKTKDDTSKAKIFYKLAIALAPNDSATSLMYANRCMSISKQVKWTKGIGLAYYAFAKAYYEITAYFLSLQNCSRAYDIFKSLTAKEHMAITLRLNGAIYDRLGYYTKALENDFTALRLYEEIDDQKGIETCYLNIGVVYHNISDYDKAIEYYNKALTEATNSNDKYDIASVLGNMASVFYSQNKFDSADVHYQRATKIFEEINFQSDVARCYFNRGNLSKKLYDAKSAYEYFMRAVQIDKRQGIKMELADDYGGIGILYLDLADSAAKYAISPLLKADKKSLLQRAQYYFAQALSIGNDENDIILKMYYDSLSSETEERLGNYHIALAFYKESMLYKDSIFNDENNRKIAALETQRLTEVKDKEILLLNKDKALQASEIKRQTLIKNIIIGAAVAAAIFAFFLTRSFIRRRKITFDKQVLQTEMKALRAQMNPHFIFHSLHSINKYVMENDGHTASKYLAKFAKLMRLVLENSCEQEITIENDLAALELYMQLESLRFENGFKYSIEIDPHIDKENTLIPPLMLQPFAENAIVHGISDKEDGLIKINIHTENNNMIKCIVEDNGCGGATLPIAENDKKRKSLGIRITQERLNIINQLKKAKAAVNIFDLKDAENKPRGSRIELLLPLQLAV